MTHEDDALHLLPADFLIATESTGDAFEVSEHKTRQPAIGSEAGAHPERIPSTERHREWGCFLPRYTPFRRLHGTSVALHSIVPSTGNFDNSRADGVFGLRWLDYLSEPRLPNSCKHNAANSLGRRRGLQPQRSTHRVALPSPRRDNQSLAVTCRCAHQAEEP